MSNPKRLIGLILVTLLVPLIPFALIGELPGERWLSAATDQDLRFAFAGFGVLAADIFIPVPSSVVLTAVGARLDVWPGWLVAWSGLTAGQCLGFAAGRLWPARWTPEVNRQPTVLAVLLTRPVPVLAEAMVIAAGALRHRPVSILLACGLGNAAYALVMVLSGAALLSAENTAVAIVVAVLFPTVGWFTWEYLRRPQSRQASDDSR